jgi:RimJ/RimL family protein N-acetyltransferase
VIDFGLGVALDTLGSPFKLRAWRNNPLIWRWTRQSDLITSAQHKLWFDSLGVDPTIRMYGIWNTDELGKLDQIGVCGLTSINMLNRNAEFSLYIAPEFHREGLSKPSLLTLFYHGFKNMNLRLIWGETFEDNFAQKIFSNIGMKEDGRRREFYFKDGKYCDAILFSVLDHEFLERNGERTCFG